MVDKQQTKVEESDGKGSCSPCWRCGGTISKENHGYNIWTKVPEDPIYHPSVLGYNPAISCAPSSRYRWLCNRCARIEGYVW